MNSPRINPRELSSRKLWQLAQTRTRKQISMDELAAVIAELARRRQDLERLQAIIEGDSPTG